MYHSPSRETSIDFGVRRSKAKVTRENCLQICFWMVTPVRINEMTSIHFGFDKVFGQDQNMFHDKHHVCITQKDPF